MLKKIPKNPEKKEKNLSKKNFSELEKFFHKLVTNFWQINHEDKIFLKKNISSEEILISNFKKIINRRANNWEVWLIFIFEEIEKSNKKIFEIFKEDFLFAKKIMETNWKIFSTIKIS